jgi:hypothetical protein
VSSSQSEEPDYQDTRDEARNVRSWRAERFLELGFPLRVATIMAKRSDISTHVADQILKAGASVEQAEKILL